MKSEPTLIEKFTSIDKKFPWSFLGLVSGFLFFLGGLYLTVFYVRSPGFKLEVLSNGPVYDIKENLSKLEISYDGQNIKQQGQELSFLSVRITNDGNANLSLSAFDKEALPRFVVPDSKIITIEALPASNRYLKEHSKILQIGTNEGVISPVIMEQGEYFAFRLLLLHPSQLYPEIKVSGKIEGIKGLGVTTPTPPEEIGFFKKAFGGDILVQLTRLAAYLISGIAMLIGISMLFVSLSRNLEKRRRKKVVRKFKSAFDFDIPKKVNSLLHLYEKRGEHVITSTCELLRDSEGLRVAIENQKNIPPASPVSSEFCALVDSSDIDSFTEISNRRRGYHHTVIQILLDESIVRAEHETIIVDLQSLDLLSRFESFLLAFEPPKRRRTKSTYQSANEDSDPVDKLNHVTTPNTSADHHE